MRSAIFNYIPYKQRNTNFYIWYAYYKNDLITIFKFIRYNFKEDYAKWDNVLFTKFCYFTYRKSSRYVPQNL